MQAKDIMRRNTITAIPEMTVSEVAQLFRDHRISGAPVVDMDGALLGVISQTDLVRRDCEKALAAEEPASGSEPGLPLEGFQVQEPDYTRTREVMTPAVISAEEDTPVEELARRMLKSHIHRIVITRRGRLCGIVTSMDLIRAVLLQRKKACQASA